MSYNPTTVNSALAGTSELADYYLYGNSYAAGSGASVAAFSYGSRLGVRFKANSTNIRGVAGALLPSTVNKAVMAGASSQWVAGTKGLVVLDDVLNYPGRQLTTTNSADLAAFAVNLRTFLRIARCSAYMPHNDASIAYAGTWAAVGLTQSRLGTIQHTTAASSTASIAGFTDTEITVMVVCFGSSNTATFTVSVGGTTYGTVTTNTAEAPTADFNQAYNIQAIRVAGLPAGSKTVVVTFTGGAELYFDGYLTRSATSYTPPSVVLVTGQPIGAYNFDVLGSGYGKAAGDAYLTSLNASLVSVAAEAEFGGTAFVAVANPGALGFDYTKHLAVDGRHPNNIGHAIYADAIQNAAVAFPYRNGLNSV